MKNLVTGQEVVEAVRKLYEEAQTYETKEELASLLVRLWAVYPYKGRMEE